MFNIFIILGFYSNYQEMFNLAMNACCFSITVNYILSSLCNLLFAMLPN